MPLLHTSSTSGASNYVDIVDLPPTGDCCMMPSTKVASVCDSLPVMNRVYQNSQVSVPHSHVLFSREKVGSLTFESMCVVDTAE